MKFGVCLCLCSLIICAAEQPAKLIFDRAVQALAAGDYTAAEQGFKYVVRQQPNNVGALGNLGVIYARTNRADEAIAVYRRALRIGGDDEAILLNLGLVYLKQDSHALALPYFARVVAMDHQHRQARQLLAVCRLYTGQVELAIRDLEGLKTAHPQDEELLFLLGFAYLRNGDSEKAKAVFQQMFAVAGASRAQFLFGRACYEAALFPQAEQSFLEVARLDPNFPGLHLALGKLFISERRTNDAVDELKLALKENLNNEDASYFLGGLLVQEARYAEGISYLEHAKELKPDSWAIYFYLGKAKLRLNETAAAVSLLERAAALNPDEANAQYQLGKALEADGQKPAAARAFRRARDLKANALNEIKIPGIR